MTTDSHNNIVVFDFFCGCGGTSLGFQKAGMEIAFALDIDPDAQKTFTTNFPHATFSNTSITKLKDAELQPTLDKYQNRYKLFSRLWLLS